MIDESFHLTPVDVRGFNFGKALRGYDPVAVENFRRQVIEELERLTRLNLDLDSKAKNFHEQLKSFRERDKALNDALVSAQQLRSEIREQSEREAQLILREARQQADHIIEAARKEIRGMQEELGALERMRRGYLTQLRMLVERQLAEIAAAEAAPTGIVRTHSDATRPAGRAPIAEPPKPEGQAQRAPAPPPPPRADGSTNRIIPGAPTSGTGGGGGAGGAGGGGRE